MLDDVEEFLKKIKEFKESEEFKKTKEILDLIDTVDEIMKRYYDLINPKPKIIMSDRTSGESEEFEHVKLPEGFGEFGYVDGEFVDYYHEHIWVLKNTHTGGEDYQCSICDSWKTVNWNSDLYSFDMEYFYSDKLLGC